MCTPDKKSRANCKFITPADVFSMGSMVLLVTKLFIQITLSEAFHAFQDHTTTSFHIRRIFQHHLSIIGRAKCYSRRTVLRYFQSVADYLSFLSLRRKFSLVTSSYFPKSGCLLLKIVITGDCFSPSFHTGNIRLMKIALIRGTDHT